VICTSRSGTPASTLSGHVSVIPPAFPRRLPADATASARLRQPGRLWPATGERSSSLATYAELTGTFTECEAPDRGRTICAVHSESHATYTRGMQPAIRSARVLSAALVAILVVCGVTLSGGSGAYAAPSRMPQHTHTVPEQHVMTPHAHRVTVGAPRRLDDQWHGGDTGPAASLGTAKHSPSTGVGILPDGRLALRVHHLSPTCARAPPV
jgi:hypothetical protein